MVFVFLCMTYFTRHNPLGLFMLLQMAKIYSFLLLSSITLSVCIYVCLYIIFMCNHLYFVLFLFLFFSFIFIHWRLITLQYCSGFCHTLTWISHGFTGIPQITSPGWMHETSARAWCTGKIQRDCFYFFIGVWLVCKPFPLQEEVRVGSSLLTVCRCAGIGFMARVCLSLSNRSVVGIFVLIWCIWIFQPVSRFLSEGAAPWARVDVVCQKKEERAGASCVPVDLELRNPEKSRKGVLSDLIREIQVDI